MSPLQYFPLQKTSVLLYVDSHIGDQVHDVPATLLVSVDASPLPDGVAVKALAENVARLLEDTGTSNVTRDGPMGSYYKKHDSLCSLFFV